MSVLQAEPATRERAPEASGITYWHEGLECCDAVWEAAYARFETPEEEIDKFTKRFHRLGVDRMARDLDIVDLFCGRGNGLVALQRLGFNNLEGVDLSPSLLKQYEGDAKLYVADCRDLKFESESKDLMIVQGGLHHLPTVPEDLTAVLSEVQRVLKPGGRFAIVEPWWTPFLRAVHSACEVKLFRRCYAKLDALAVMTEREATTYFQWLGQPKVIQAELDRHFDRELCKASFGKLLYVGRKA